MGMIPACLRTGSSGSFITSDSLFIQWFVTYPTGSVGTIVYTVGTVFFFMGTILWFPRSCTLYTVYCIPEKVEGVCFLLSFWVERSFWS